MLLFFHCNICKYSSFFNENLLRILEKVCNFRGLFCNPKTGRCSLQIKIAMNLEIIFDFEVRVNKVFEDRVNKV